MKERLEKIIAEQKRCWSLRPFAASAIAAFLLFAGSMVVNYEAGSYAVREAGNAVTDILLDNLPVVNTDIVFSEGAILFALLVAVIFLLEPRTIPFVLKSIVLFILVRSFFVVMTHIGPFPDHIQSDSKLIRHISFGSDLFFSGHTGLPFLFALIFWDRINLRRLFLFCSVVAAFAVIFGHMHYTIDVFSAFFITYGIYHLALRFFRQDYRLFVSGSYGA